MIGLRDHFADKQIDSLLNIVNQAKFNLLKNNYDNNWNSNRRKNKILKGLEKVYEKLIEFKKAKNSELVVLRDNKIVKIKPE